MEPIPEIPEGVFLFDGMTAAQRGALLNDLPPPERFRRGARLYSRHCFRRALGIVLSGTVRVFRDDEDGRRVVMNQLGPAGVFGAAALFGDEAEYVTEIEAAEDCVIQFIGQEQMTGLMRRDFRLAENYIRFLTGRIRFLNRRIAGFTGGQADERLSAYLLDHRGPDGLVALPVSMVELAQTLNIARSSLYRSLDALEAAGKIRREGRKVYIVHPEQLSLGTAD